MKKSGLFKVFFIIFAGVISVFPLLAKSNNTVDMAVFNNLRFRNIGPAIMGGRLTDIEGIPGNPKIIYVATASAGVWKTIDGGVTWLPIFDSQGIQSIGDIAVDPSNPDVIWVGTGEDNPRNSTSFGKGVFKSTDGGKTWKCVGLKNTERISRIIINPRNPNIVYVAAIGHVFGPSTDRGVYMTEDGGKTWEKVLYIDEYHGASDIEMNPSNPNVLYAGMWYFQRKPWDFDSGDKKGGVFRSVDGGYTWKKLTEGLPEFMGRIGIKVAPSMPQRVYVIAEAREGALFRSDDGGDHFQLIHKGTEIVSRGFYYTELRVDPQDENRIYAIASPLWVSEDGGKTFRRIARRIHGDFHTMWIDPKNPYRVFTGSDGGLAVSYNRGKTWEFVNNFIAAQFYQINADNRLPFYHVCGGLQDNGTWCAPSRTRGYIGILNDHWYSIGGGDGFFVVTHPTKPWIHLVEYQGGGISLVNTKTGESIDNTPYVKRNEGGPAGELKYRFDWDAPIVQSPHDPMTVYLAGNVVFRSKDFGLTWERISPDLTRNDPQKLGAAGGPIFPENTTAENHCTIISLAESPAKPGIIWAGTDDGNLQVTVDGARHWTNVIRNLKGIKPESPVSHIEPSWTDPATAYVAFDRHMFDDFSPYIFVTHDYGRTWKRITNGLPDDAYVHVVKEDPRNSDVLYAGTEIGLFVTFDKGRNWERLSMNNLPPVAVHDIIIHPRENDLILGTHGRGIWIFDDITPVQEIKKALVHELYIFPPRTALLYSMLETKGSIGDKVFVGPNPPYGALIYFYMKDNLKKDEKAELVVYDENGNQVRKLSLKPVKGINLAVWDLTYDPPVSLERGERLGRRSGAGPKVLPGKYTIKIKAGELEAEAPLTVKVDPTITYKIEELKEQLRISLELRDMISNVNKLIMALDSIKRQLSSIKKTAVEVYQKPSSTLCNSIKENLKKVDELKYSLTRKEKTYASEYYWGEKDKLVENLKQLFWSIQSPFRAPTPAQIEFFEEIKSEYNTRINRVKNFFEKDIKGLNSMLKKVNLPIVAIPAMK